jgi:hypothetical protein
MTAFRKGDSIISFTACGCCFSSLQPASNSMNKSTDALIIMGSSDLKSKFHQKSRPSMSSQKKLCRTGPWRQG